MHDCISDVLAVFGCRAIETAGFGLIYVTVKHDLNGLNSHIAVEHRPCQESRGFSSQADAICQSSGWKHGCNVSLGAILRRQLKYGGPVARASSGAYHGDATRSMLRTPSEM